MPAQPSKLPARLIIVVGGVFLLMLILHLVGVAMLRYFVERELHPALPKGTYIGEVHLNLFSGSLRIHDFELRDQDGVRMRFGELRVKVNPWRLVTGAVHVQEAALSHAYARVERRADGAFDLGLPAFGGEGPPAPAGEPVDLTLDGVDLDRITIEYHDGELASAGYVHSLKVGAYSLRADKQQVPLDWRLSWDGRSIDGKAVVAIDQGAIAANGELATELLDIGRAQQLARMQPVARGEVLYQGPFAWQAPRLTLSGRISAPALAYSADGQQADISDLAIPAFELDLFTAPAVRADLGFAQPVTLKGLTWQAAEQGAELSALQLGGRLQFAAGKALDAQGLTLRAQGLAWRDAQRQAQLGGVDLAADVHQGLSDGSGPPTLTARVSAASVDYQEAAQALAAQLAGLNISDLTLNATDGQPGRGLAANIAIGNGKVTQDANVIDWSTVSAKLQGRLAEAVKIAGDVAIDGLSVASPALPNGPLTLSQVSASGLDVGEQTSFDRLRLQGLGLPAALPATALKIAAVDLSAGRYSAQSGVSLGEIVIDGLQTGVIRNEAGAWQHVMSSAKASANPQPPPTTQASPPKEDLAWKIAAVSITGDSHITVADRQNPGMQPVRYGVKKIQVGSLASTAPDSNTPFEIALSPDEYSEFRIAGDVRPLAKKLYLKAQGHLHGFGLSSVNGLIANDLGHRFLAGQLDNDFSITIDSEKLDMKNALAMASLDVEEIEGKEGPPLSTAIALLEDRDGNIKLEVPVAGDLSDPDFRVLGALNPIIMKAVAGTAALAIQPLGSVLLVGGLLADQALKVTFDPALFDPGSTELNAASRKYLGQLAGKLSQKPKLKVRVCGVVADAERKKDKNGNYVDKEADVLAVAQRRADAAVAYLVSKGAGRKQLRRCRPSIDKKADAKPRVDIKF